MALYGRARQLLLPENNTAPPIVPTQIIWHTAVDAPGPTSLFPYFARLDVTAETHFFIRLDGVVEQYMDTNKRADANNMANRRPDGSGAISIETEDDRNPEGIPWSQRQIAAMKELMRWAWIRHPLITKNVCRSWDDPGIGYHSMWGAPSEWTVVRGKTCPGSLRIAQFKNIIAPWIAEQTRPATTLAPTRKTKHMLVRNQSTGAVLHVLGGAATLLIDNATDYQDFLRAGIPVVDVQQSQFSRYEKLRVDK